MEEAKYLMDLKKKLKEKKEVCIYPMGIAGKALCDKLESRDVHIDFFGDRNPALWGSEYKGKVCLSPEELKAKEQEGLIVIIASLYYDEIKKQLQEMGVKNTIRFFFEKIAAEEYLAKNPDVWERAEQVKNILADEKSKMVYEHLLHAWRLENIPEDYYRDIWSKNQYFDKELFSWGTEEVLVDVGAYTGDTALEFLQSVNGEYEKMHLFELDPKIYKKLMENAAGIQAKGTGIVQCYPYGISNRHQQIEFSAGDSNSSIQCNLNSNKLEKGEIRTLDELLKDEKVTFIKMDIEGAEKTALEGARTLIAQQKPILAICIYHSPQDMLELPLYMKALDDDYQIYIRHYTGEMLETVCYAVPKSRR